MEKLLIILSLGIVTACGSSYKNEDGTDMEVTTETSEKIQNAQDENIELEQIDGELDSLINSLN